ncbi:MAG TPA: YafY family protein [Thermomicrobiaceae bacterium]|nr:YafY family protein [Thermomicrobiaceae bacterium]
MNRTERLYALVEELRARAPRTIRAVELAERFEVTTRTIERDLLALQVAGVPIWARSGPGGGYGINADFSLPPLNLSAEEAVAIATALATAPPMPFGAAGKSAMAKVVAVMQPAPRSRAVELAGQIRLAHFSETSAPANEAVRDLISRVLLDPVAISLSYVDREGRETTRVVEPVGLLGSRGGWYLVAWCRLRQGPRTFKLDRIHDIKLTGESIPQRSLDDMLRELPFGLDQPSIG